MKKIAENRRIAIGSLISNYKKQGYTYDQITSKVSPKMSTSTVRRVHKEYLQWEQDQQIILDKAYKALPWYKKLWHWITV